MSGMMELMAMFRSFGTWYFLCVVCLLDVAFILAHLCASSGPKATEEHLNAQLLRTVLARQDQLARSIQESQQQLELLRNAREKALALERLTRRVSELEKLIERLK